MDMLPIHNNFTFNMICNESNEDKYSKALVKH